MKSLVQPLIDRAAWMEEFAFTTYSQHQQDQLWDLVTRAMEMQALDTLLDQLNQHDQRALIQHLAEDELESQVEGYLARVLPDYQHLLEMTILRYKEQLKRDLTRIVK
jgi:RNAse (barnase) inhibitor barstar